MSIFDNFQLIQDEYLLKFSKKDSIFSEYKDLAYLPSNSQLREWFKLLDINFSDFHEILPSTLENCILSAKHNRPIGYKFSGLKPVAHIVLEHHPNLWTHFRLVMKEYGHDFSYLTNDIKIQAKRKRQEDLVQCPEHKFNSYIEFLCPKFQNKILNWEHKYSEDTPNLNHLEQFYPLNIFKHLLKEAPYLPIIHNQSEFELILGKVKEYINFKNKFSESIDNKIADTIFDFISRNNTKDFSDFYSGVFDDDIKFKNNFLSVLESLSLKNLVKHLEFLDNSIVLELDFETTENFLSLELVKKAAKFYSQDSILIIK